MKKLATIMNARKKNAMGGLLSRLGAISGDRASTPMYITAVHPSVVDISNRVCMALNTLSKFMSWDLQLRSLYSLVLYVLTQRPSVEMLPSLQRAADGIPGSTDTRYVVPTVDASRLGLDVVVIRQSASNHPNSSTSRMSP